MGVERAVTRWYILRQAILNEIAVLEEVREGGEEDGGHVKAVPTEGEESRAERLAKAQERLRVLGPCPKPMMG